MGDRLSSQRGRRAYRIIPSSRAQSESEPSSKRLSLRRSDSRRYLRDRIHLRRTLRRSDFRDGPAPPRSLQPSAQTHADVPTPAHTPFIDGPLMFGLSDGPFMQYPTPVPSLRETFGYNSQHELIIVPLPDGR